MRNVLATGLFAALSVTGGVQSRSQATPPGPMTVAGCLASRANQTFTLTVPPPERPSTGAAATTVAYTLEPGSHIDLKDYVGKKVEVTGVQTSEHAVATVAEPDPPLGAPTRAVGISGTSGASGAIGAAGTTQAHILAKALRVTSIKTVAGDCRAGK